MSAPKQPAGSPPLRRQLWYLPLLGIGLALLMVRVLLMARLLDVPGFARFSMGMVVASMFCMLGALGLYPLLQRDMPIQLARGRRRRALVLLAQSLLVAAGCALVGALAALLPRALAGLSGGAFMIALANGLSQQTFLIATAESRSAGEPLRYAKQSFWRAVAIVILSVVVAAATGSPMLVLATEAALSFAVSLTIVTRAAHRAGLRMPLLWRLAAVRLRRIPWHAALVFLGISAIMTVLDNADRWLGAELLPVPAFAQYAFAAVAIVIALAVQSMINAALYPLVARRFATAGVVPAFRLAAWASLGMLGTAAVASVPLFYAAAWAIDRWYPAYRPAVTLLPLLLAVCCLRISDFWSGFLIASGHERRLLLLTASVGALGGGLWFAWQRLAGVEIDARAIAWLAVILAASSHASVALAATLRRRAEASSLRGRLAEPSAP